MQTNKTVALGIGTGIFAGLAAGMAMHLIGYEFLAAGVGILTTCFISFAIGYFGSRR